MSERFLNGTESAFSEPEELMDRLHPGFGLGFKDCQKMLGAGVDNEFSAAVLTGISYATRCSVAELLQLYGESDLNIDILARQFTASGSGDKASKNSALKLPELCKELKGFCDTSATESLRLSRGLDNVVEMAALIALKRQMLTSFGYSLRTHHLVEIYELQGGFGPMCEILGISAAEHRAADDSPPRRRGRVTSHALNNRLFQRIRRTKTETGEV